MGREDVSSFQTAHDTDHTMAARHQQPECTLITAPEVKEQLRPLETQTFPDTTKELLDRTHVHQQIRCRVETHRCRKIESMFWTRKIRAAMACMRPGYELITAHTVQSSFLGTRRTQNQTSKAHITNEPTETTRYALSEQCLLSRISKCKTSPCEAT